MLFFVYVRSDHFRNTAMITNINEYITFLKNSERKRKKKKMNQCTNVYKAKGFVLPCMFIECYQEYVI